MALVELHLHIYACLLLREICLREHTSSTHRYDASVSTCASCASGSAVLLLRFQPDSRVRPCTLGVPMIASPDGENKCKDKRILLRESVIAIDHLKRTCCQAQTVSPERAERKRVGCP